MSPHKINTKLIGLIKKGGVVVLPTDTIYGIHASALNEEAVEKVYKIRKRNRKKPFIVLISSVKDLKIFKIKLDAKTKAFLTKIWPNKVSVILPCPQKQFKYLHRGTNKLAFRYPKKGNLLSLLKETGPLISTSVNLEGGEPAKSIKEAKEYFGNRIDYYMDEGQINSSSSMLVEINNGEVQILRQGDVEEGLVNTLN